MSINKRRRMKRENQEISQLTGYTLQVFFLNWIVICLFFLSKNVQPRSTLLFFFYDTLKANRLILKSALIH